VKGSTFLLLICTPGFCFCGEALKYFAGKKANARRDTPTNEDLFAGPRAGAFLDH